MDKLKFLDGTIIDIEDGATLSKVTHITSNEANVLFVYKTQLSNGSMRTYKEGE